MTDYNYIIKKIVTVYYLKQYGGPTNHKTQTVTSLQTTGLEPLV